MQSVPQVEIVVISPTQLRISGQGTHPGGCDGSRGCKRLILVEMVHGATRRATLGSVQGHGDLIYRAMEVLGLEVAVHFGYSGG